MKFLDDVISEKGIAKELVLVPRYRTIDGCVEDIKESDPKSAISKYFIRKLCKSGKVQCQVAGNKLLVNWDSLIENLRRVR